ncbi:SDR family NAD(P)-dependent oxidoreductase [Alicyclobacillus tolerans]|uniref:SDR family NAD(P)-dependent oxidoreductase n=1 Tax=Alicyclobacillus tolerans TaxID=90970 RepID=UPI001F1EDC07|nr:SDR family NAD(P)-dependent oxidoreductase [Alicyclobacillus tolerans]MCF8564014.1 SDR family NAD(P)-dependent oxidoreductase [Alicyclobacillus tolerans]
MSIQVQGKVAVVTGASSGIGAATAIELAKAGFQIVLGARRLDKLQATVARIEEAGASAPLALELDVTSRSSCVRFVDRIVSDLGAVHVLVNNAGLALGTARVGSASEADEDDWETMLDTNVLGLLRMTRLMIPKMLESGGGHIVNIGSTAGRQAYAGGAGYCGTKFAVRAVTESLREELLGQPIKITEIDPGMVETEFSVVRYHGDADKASAVYAGMTPLGPEDIADCIAFAVTRKPHVNIDAMIVKPLDQAGPGRVVRR